jgi:hypothetical protein
MDDLFGDLPAAKNSAPSDVPASASSVTANSTAAATSVANKPTEPAAELPSKSKSLVSALGTAGTSMAFVPQALRKKKRSDAQNKQPQKNNEKRPREESAHQSEADQLPKENSIPPIDKVTIPAATILLDTNMLEPEDVDEGEPYLENEPAALRQLHELAKTDPRPYNPHTPNDYLAYRDKKKTEAVRKDLQAAALAKLQAHEVLRQMVQEERRRIELSGDVDKIAESRGMGRGRGRGVSNLPAWLIKKQMEKDGGEGDMHEVKEGQFDDAGCTISLLNMVSPGQFDNELAEEVREECGRCGRVLNVNIVDASSMNEYVRVDVTFDRRESAVEAIKVFDGRMFGERQIIARICDDK